MTFSERKKTELTLLGSPKSTQNCYKYTCRGNFASAYMDKKCKDIKEDYQWQIKSQYKGELLKTPLRVILRLWHGTKRVTDVDNFNKLVLDALTGIVYEDDSQIMELTITKHFDKNQPRIEVEIEELQGN